MKRGSGSFRKKDLSRLLITLRSCQRCRGGKEVRPQVGPTRVPRLHASPALEPSPGQALPGLHLHPSSALTRDLWAKATHQGSRTESPASPLTTRPQSLSAPASPMSANVCPPTESTRRLLWYRHWEGRGKETLPAQACPLDLHCAYLVPTPASPFSRGEPSLDTSLLVPDIAHAHARHLPVSGPLHLLVPS